MFMFKKILFVIAVCTLIISCGKSTAKDDHGCFTDYEEAVKNAEKKNIPLLAVFTSERNDEQNEQFVTDIIKDEAFSSIQKDYSVFHVDFSSDDIQANYQIAMLFNIDVMPAVFLCTKEGYVVSKISDEEEFSSMLEFKNVLSSKKEQLNSFNQMVAQTKKGSASQKVEAIDTLYNATAVEYRNSLLPLVQEVLKLDKKNETGLAGKYILALAETEAVTAFSTGDTDSAIQKYLEAANNTFLKAEDKQECFYTAAYLAAYSGSEDYDGIMTYLQTSYDLAPQSDKAPAIKEAIEYFKLIRDNVGKNDSQDTSKIADEK